MITPTVLRLLFVFIIHGFVASNADDCECKEHIFCLYPTSKPGPACGDLKNGGFNAEEKKLALARINEYRNKVALGKETQGNPGPQPQAADMMEVTWDDYLESTAQRYAEQCISNKHSSGECRKTEKYSFGENLAWGKGQDAKTAYLSHIDAWYGEVKDFPSNIVDSYDPSVVDKSSGIQIGHYAQLVNGKTYEIGCGKTEWGDENMLVCHFGPTIYREKPLYTRGVPASLCGNDTKSSYEGLCGLGTIGLELEVVFGCEQESVTEGQASGTKAVINVPMQDTWAYSNPI
ncbi:venom allergen 5-like [Hetaerina americana]|uniref:venom allergen 5-like n=1 Tax=Hetaerina americana TaxID=62018 RepID=UPI003A7F2CF5